jgi:nucleoside phosphorylase
VSARCDVIIFAAFDPELAPLRSVLGDKMRVDVAGNVAVLRVTGIGLPAAAVGAAIHLGGPKPRAALAIGTCGAYPSSGFALGDVVVARRIWLVAPSALQGLSAFPEPMPLTIETHAPMADSISRTTGVRAADVATTLAITTDDATAARIEQSTGAHVEHLELYGVATACAARGIPLGAVLAVANVVGASGREQWRARHREASSSAAEVALRWLKDGGMADSSLRAHAAR